MYFHFQTDFNYKLEVSFEAIKSNMPIMGPIYDNDWPYFLTPKWNTTTYILWLAAYYMLRYAWHCNWFNCCNALPFVILFKRKYVLTYVLKSLPKDFNFGLTKRWRNKNEVNSFQDQMNQSNQGINWINEYRGVGA